MIGLAISEVDFNAIKKELYCIQKELFKAGSEIARVQKKDIKNDKNKITSTSTRKLEKMIDAHCANLPKLANFILPGGCDGGACLHLARAICRRVERSLVSFGKTAKIRPELYKYFNRLSDYLFAAARRENIESGEKDRCVG
jgi:cob(I)alamin adenosyltransferase